MSSIPAARKELASIARELSKKGQKGLAGEIKKVIKAHMFRRKAVRRMPIKSKPVTSAVKKKILDLADETDLHTSEIAYELGVNPGRVSEVLQGDK